LAAPGHAWNHRDVARALRAAKAAGVEVREITPDGRLILPGFGHIRERFDMSRY
jgi:hypothetical protein